MKSIVILDRVCSFGYKLASLEFKKVFPGLLVPALAVTLAILILPIAVASVVCYVIYGAMAVLFLIPIAIFSIYRILTDLNIVDYLPFEAD